MAAAAPEIILATHPSRVAQNLLGDWQAACSHGAPRVSSAPFMPRAAADDECSDHEEAAASLARRGLHPYRKCTAILGLKHCLIRWPGRLYGGLFAYDALHILYINCISYLLDAVLATMPPRMKIELDYRFKRLTSFRDRFGRTTVGVSKLSSTAYLTGEKKVAALFMWSHALGSKALLLKTKVRNNALIAFATLQTICYAVRGLRSYTVREYEYIFKGIGSNFFYSLSRINATRRKNKSRRH